MIRLLGPDGGTFLVSPQGAELVSARDRQGMERIWNAGAAWPRHSPVLFPAICRHPKDHIRVGDTTYPMGHHGFARDLDFRVDSSSRASTRLSLSDSELTHPNYPFRFNLVIDFEAVTGGLNIVFNILNPGDEVLPYGLGWHPAFVCPAGLNARVTFDTPPKSRRIDIDGLLSPEVLPIFHPPAGIWNIDAGLLKNGKAVILEGLNDSGLHYVYGNNLGISLKWKNFQTLTLWSVAVDSGFLCLEPWSGLPAENSWEGDERQRTDLNRLAPGRRNFHEIKVRFW